MGSPGIAPLVRPTKALSVIQPWATLLAIGAKRVETRSWATTHTGSLGIHASRGFPQAARDLCYQEPFRSALAAAGIDDWSELPRGALVGVAAVLGCHPVETLPKLTTGNPLTEQELAFGDYTPGRYGWTFDSPVRIEPVRMQGALGIWTIPAEHQAAARDALRAA